MRNPERIYKFCEELSHYWHEYVPDWRFSQLIENIFGSLNRDPFYLEDDKMMELIRAYFKDIEDSKNIERRNIDCGGI